MCCVFPAQGNAAEQRHTEREYRRMSKRYESVWPASSEELTSKPSLDNEDKTATAAGGENPQVPSEDARLEARQPPENGDG